MANSWNYVRNFLFTLYVRGKSFLRKRSITERKIKVSSIVTKNENSVRFWLHRQRKESALVYDFLFPRSLRYCCSHTFSVCSFPYCLRYRFYFDILRSYYALNPRLLFLVSLLHRCPQITKLDNCSIPYTVFCVFWFGS